MNFSKTITSWYAVNKRDLPWRRTQNPYFIWLSEIILQQTQIKQGLPYYERFVAYYPTVFDLAKAEETEVLKLWEGLGYYSRARNLHFTAKYVVNELKGEFPKNYKGLLQLKGVGDYTASAIASICYNEAAAVVDGNVYRVLSRYFGIDTPINTTNGIKTFKGLAQQLLPNGDIGDYNQAIMEFGARQCKPKAPDCQVCPLDASCVALEKATIRSLPVKLKKLKITKRYFNFLAVFSQTDTVLIEQRLSKGIWQQLYQLPLVETDSSTTQDELIRNTRFLEIVNHQNFTITLFNDKDIVHKLSHQHLFTKFWIVNVPQLGNDAIAINTIRNYPVPILISKFLDAYKL
ncbi:MAG: A/G-specific adenine glycosylase [Flavobacteriaceae bacterium]|nr:A/G-specific adenine glycosylase [Flavobacteriaceae bacterium]